VADAQILRMHPDDNVALCLAAVSVGDTLPDGTPASQAVAPGHKIAIAPIAVGEAVVKYGQVIGVASADVTVANMFISTM